jgi:hypothetical protein
MVKSILVGIAAALIACVLWVLAVVVLPIAVPMVIGRTTGTGGAAAAYMSSGSLFLIALVAFVITFGWQLRKGSRRPR